MLPDRALSGGGDLPWFQRSVDSAHVLVVDDVLEQIEGLANRRQGEDARWRARRDDSFVNAARDRSMLGLRSAPMTVSTIDLPLVW